MSTHPDEIEVWGWPIGRTLKNLQGGAQWSLAHKKHPPPRTLK